MKYSLVFLAVLGLALASPTHDIKRRSTTLREDLAEFLALLPVAEIADIAVEYINDDAEVQAALEYLTSASFVSLVQAVDAIPEYIDFLNYLQTAGLDVYTYVNLLHEILGIDQLPVPASSDVLTTRSLAKITGGLSGLIADIKALLPREEIAALYEVKLVESEAFADFIAHITSEEFQVIVDALVANEEYQSLREKAIAYGVDVDTVADLLLSIFGIRT